MALVLPTLRLWLLLLNIYGTFKAMKPPSQSQRSARNRSGPSARAMQLRKRELKSCLAVWVVWSMFSTVENVADRTIGLVTPFYNEIKCLVLLFLLVARSHGAEAIFLHFIHPMLRPYAPAIDDILANLHSVFDLFLLLIFLPFEYVLYWWHRWSWGKGSSNDGDDPPSDHGDGGRREPLIEERRKLRPRNESQRAMMREAGRQGQVVFQDIEDAQDRVRARSRNQGLAEQNVDPDQPIRGTKGADLGPDAVGLRTRKRVLEYPAAEGQARGPGSSTTRVHHVYRTAIDELPPAPSLQPFPILPSAPITQPVELPSNPLPIPPRPSTNPSPYEIWHPPRSVLESHRRTPPADAPPRTPSPAYPPLPSAYIFTPRLSEPPPPPPRIITPPRLMAPTPRRVSTGTTSSRNAPDAFEGIDRFPGRSAGRSNQAGPSRYARSAEPPDAEKTKQGHMQAEDFFGPALEPSIQVAEMDMDTETLSTRDDSSANEEDVGAGGGERRAYATRPAGDETVTAKRRLRGQRRGDSAVEKGKRKASTLAEPLRRSTRRARDKPSSVETDEFGFTIRPDSSTLASITTTSTSASSSMTNSPTAGPSKKLLARTKPALKAAQGGDETETSDEESEKKRRRLDQPVDAHPGDLPSAGVVEDGNISDQEELFPLGRRSVRGGRGKRNTAAAAQASKTATRTTRASTKRPVPAKEGHSVGAPKKGRIR